MTFEELNSLYQLPLFNLIQRSRQIHEENWPAAEVQLCTLLSIKTGAAPKIVPIALSPPGIKAE